MPPKRRKFDSTFPAARIKKIMQLDDDVGRVASSVPVVISRAVEIFLQTLLSRANQYATSRNAKTLTVGHLKHCIVNEKQWDFLKDLTAKIPDISTDADGKEDSSPPKKGRKRRLSPSAKGGPSGKRKSKMKAPPPMSVPELEEEEEESESNDSDEDSRSDSGSRVSAISHASTGHLQPVSSLTSSTSASHHHKTPMDALSQQQFSKDCGGALSIPDLIAAGSSGLSRNEDNSDDDYD